MTPLQHYELLLDLTSRMLAEARHAQWEQVVALSADYVAAVEKLKSLPAPAAADGNTEAQQELLSRIIENDNKIRELVTPELHRLGSLLGDSKRQKNVVQAYCGPSMNQ